MQKRNAELETSPLIEELKRRTEANKAQNKAIVKEATVGAQGGIYDDTAGMKMVRYAGANDLAPVTRIMNPQQVKELEAQGFKLNVRHTWSRNIPAWLRFDPMCALAHPPPHLCALVVVDTRSPQCPKWGGACEVEQRKVFKKVSAQAPPPSPPPPSPEGSD